MTQPPKRRTREQQRREAKEALLRAATVMFATHGVAEVSLADIGRAAGFSRGLVNHHFGSRAELMRRLAERTQRRMIELLAAYAQQESPSEGGVERLVEMVERYLELGEELEVEARAYQVIRGSALASEGALRDVLADGEAQARDHLAVAIRRDQRAGSIRVDLDAADAAAWLIAMVRGVLGSHLLARDRDLDLTKRTCAQVVRAVFTVDAADASTQRLGPI